MRKQLFINGEWSDAAGGKTIDVVNPATEEVIASVASAEESDVDRAVAAARAALDGPWGTLAARDRGRLLWKLGEALARAAPTRSRGSRRCTTASRFSSRGTSRFPPPPSVCSTTPAGRTRFTARRSRSAATFSPTRCASRSAWSPRSSPGIFRCCWRPGKSRRPWPAAIR